MLDFTQVTEDVIIQFLIDNVAEFTNHPPPEFPENLKSRRSERVVFIKRPSGFAVVVRGISHEIFGELANPELMFLYTSPAHRGKGEAGRLIEEIKQNYNAHQPLQLVCRQSLRELYQQHGFIVVASHEDSYTMVCSPMQPDLYKPQ